VQKTLEFPRIAAIATSAVVVAGAFAITPVTTNTAAPRNTNADVALTAAPAYTNPCPSGVEPYCLPTVAQAYANLFNSYTQAALEWMAEPALNGTWTVAEAAPGDAGAYALQQASDGRWLLSTPTGAEGEVLVKLAAAAEGQGWTLQHPSDSDPIPGDPTWIINPPGDLIAGGNGGCQGGIPAGGIGECIPVYPLAGVGAVTAAIATPFPILRQIANNLAFYAGLLGTRPLDEAVATIVATVAAHIRAVGAAAEGLIPRAIEGEIKRNQALLEAVQKASGYVFAELTTNFGSGNAIKAFRAGFLSPRGYDGTVASSIPGTFLAGATGPGIIASPAESGYEYYVASVVVQNQRAQGRIVNALGGYRGQPVPQCAPQGGPCPRVLQPPMAARSAARSTNVRAAAARAAAATTPAAVDSAADTGADTATASTDTVRKPAGTHRAARSAASRATAS